MLEILKQRFVQLKQVWMFSDSQPTEILLALVNIFLTPLVTGLEIGNMWFYQILLVLTGIYQLWCVANTDLECRIRAAFMTFGMYFATILMYMSSVGFPTPTHFGWFVLFFASFSSLRKIKREQLTRK